MQSATYALVRVTVVRAMVARSLLVAGLIGGFAALFLPELTDRWLGVGIGVAFFGLGILYGLVHRLGWWRQQALKAEKAAFAVTVEPPGLTARRYRLIGPWWTLGLMALVTALGLVAGAAAGLLVAGLGVGLLLSVRQLVRWERQHEVLLWARTEDGWLLGRRKRVGGWFTTGPAAGKVRPVARAARPGGR